MKHSAYFTVSKSSLACSHHWQSRSFEDQDPTDGKVGRHVLFQGQSLFHFQFQLPILSLGMYHAVAGFEIPHQLISGFEKEVLRDDSRVASPKS